MKQLQEQSRLLDSIYPYWQEDARAQQSERVEAFRRVQIGRLRAVVGKVASERGIAHVFDATALVYSANDVTPLVVQRAGKRAPKAKKKKTLNKPTPHRLSQRRPNEGTACRTRLEGRNIGEVWQSMPSRMQQTLKRRREQSMTAIAPLPGNTTTEILRRWQSIAAAHWKHIDSQLLGSGGAVWEAMQCVLEVLHTVPAGEASTSRNRASAPRSDVFTADAFAEGPKTLPTQERSAFFTRLSDSLQECAGQLARLPIAWPDLRQLLHLLGAQMRHELQRGSAPSASRRHRPLPDLL